MTESKKYGFTTSILHSDRKQSIEHGSLHKPIHTSVAFGYKAARDLARIGQLCRERGILYIVDNTMTTPYLFRPKTVGAGLVVNALAKGIGGHGNALGGSLTDTGLFDWSGYPNIFENYKRFPPAQW